jgi:hypothetical protein
MGATCGHLRPTTLRHKCIQHRLKSVVNVPGTVRRTAAATRERGPVGDPASKILKAVERVRRADDDAAMARKALRELMRAEIAAGRASKSSIARILGVSRQRVGRMLEE